MRTTAFVVGVTGGIGSGKTAATDFFAQKGINIVDADVAARQVVEPGNSALDSIAQRFGKSILQEDGRLNRRQLRHIIFADTAEKVWLEQLLHPIIRQQLVLEIAQSQSPYTILVSPLLMETDQKALVDRILVVDVPEAVQVERTIARDDTTNERVLAIIRQQISRQERVKQADDIVDNSQSLLSLHQQLGALHQQYLNLCTSHFSGSPAP